jgi:hypothetical protein
MRYSFFLGTIDPGSYIGIPSSFRTQGPAGPGSAVKRATLEWGQQEPTEGLSLSLFSLSSPAGISFLSGFHCGGENGAKVRATATPVEKSTSSQKSAQPRDHAREFRVAGSMAHPPVNPAIAPQNHAMTGLSLEPQMCSARRIGSLPTSISAASTAGSKHRAARGAGGEQSPVCRRPASD